MDSDDVQFVQDTKWAKLRLGANEMAMLELLFANGNAGADYPYRHTPEYATLANLNLVEAVTGSRGVKCIRFTATGAKIALRYISRAQREDPWWRIKPADQVSTHQRSVVIAWEGLLNFIVKLEFMGPAERQAFLATVKNIDDEHLEHTLAFVNAVFAVYD